LTSNSLVLPNMSDKPTSHGNISEEQSYLPERPSYEHSCDLLDNAADEYWIPVLEFLRNKHQLGAGEFVRIKEGANALFKLGGRLIIKLVPPNWGYQGEAEIEGNRIVSGKLSIAIPEVIGNGEVNRWIYVVMSVLPGVSLADVWDGLEHQQKLHLIAQLGRFIRELHLIATPKNSCLKVDWAAYHQQLLDECVPRHVRKKLSQKLAAQIPAYLAASSDYFDDTKSIFIHMDLHQWNLMVERTGQDYHICGILDFGDAVIGKSRLLELATPLLFLCQGNRELCACLLEKNYGLFDQVDKVNIQKNFMLVSLLRPACDFNFVLQQVPSTGARNSLDEIASELFPV